VRSGSSRYSRSVATALSAQIAELGPFKLLTKGGELPVFAFTLADGVEGFSVFDVSGALHERGWQVPAYSFPDNRTDLAALRVVVRNGFGHDMAHLFLADLKRQLPRLEKQGQPIHDSASGAGFHH
jgi:glutamate decarboxylase